MKTIFLALALASASTGVSDPAGAPPSASKTASPFHLGLNPAEGAGARALGGSLGTSLFAPEPFTTGVTAEAAVLDHWWVMGGGSVSAAHQIPWGSRVNVNELPHALAASAAGRLGVRYVLNPGDVVEHIGAAGVRLGLASSATRRDLAIWDVLTRPGDAGTSVSGVVTASTHAGLGVDVRVWERVRLRVASDVGEAGLRVLRVDGQGLWPTSEFLRFGASRAWARMAAQPMMSLLVRF